MMRREMQERMKDKLKEIERALGSIIAMPQCGASILLITPDYIKSYLEGDIELETQIYMARKLDHHVIMMLDRDLTPVELKQVERMVKGLNVFARMNFDSSDFESCFPEITRILNRYKRMVAK